MDDGAHPGGHITLVDTAAAWLLQSGAVCLGYSCFPTESTCSLALGPQIPPVAWEEGRLLSHIPSPAPHLMPVMLGIGIKVS